MSDSEKHEAAPEEPAGIVPAPAPKLRKSLSKSRRELTEEELNQSGVRLMMMDELDRLESVVLDLESYREKYYAAAKDVAVLSEKRSRQLAFEILYAVCLALGVGLLMLAPTLPAGALTYTDVALGFVLIGTGVAAKWRQL